MKKMIVIFKRDLKVSIRDFLSLYLLLFPLIFAILIEILVPSISSSSIDLGVNENLKEEIDFYSDYVSVETFSNDESLNERVLLGDNLIGINSESKMIIEGDEPEYFLEYIKALKSLKTLNANPENSMIEIVRFDNVINPLKKILVNIALMFTSVLGGMIIALNIVEEKQNNTISLIGITPMSKLSFILGKSILGVLLVLIGSFSIIFITGFGFVNVFQMAILLLISCLISVIVGFIEGVTSRDQMDAIASIKMLFMPMMGAIAAIELLAPKWQCLFYVFPFYWTYKGNGLILTKSSNWNEILLYSLIIFSMTIVVYLFLKPKINKNFN